MLSESPDPASAAPRPGIYERLGVRPLINARGTHTRLGGSLMPDEVLDAMREAAGAYVVLDELQDQAGRLIAGATGAEAGLVTGGAEAGLLIGAAACVTREDHAAIERLPDLGGMPHQAIMHKAHRNGYDHAIRVAGLSIVEVGYAHRTLPEQLEAAFGDDTALVLYVVAPWTARGALSLEHTCEVAHRHGIPVLVDAAAMLPPAENLRRFIAAGADLVTFSGGKGLRGPQASGILAGRADLIAAARLNASPRHAVGRAAKAAKEDIVGLMVALQRFMKVDHEAELAGWLRQADVLMARLDGIPGVDLRCVHDGYEHPTPDVEVVFRRETGIRAHDVVLELEESDPRIFLFESDGPTAVENSLLIHCASTRPGEEVEIGEQLRSAIERRLARPAIHEHVS
ncbi:MAG: aminotransferase class V-fold PLP-dependent enzyme [Candidatus Dormibacteraeota bacterium]|nr:aminotransferase class V-fold PLP-dependent enzyme [Candidatus Dormibacteraeota bacterium]MBO0743700.1 aminotransferase class V-fold PLP-dependent enzyme [Candidatus Dormibacteraeota bacterium]